MKNHITFLDTLRAVAICMVVGIHTLGYVDNLSSSVYRVLDYIVHTVGVAIFYMSDGYLFAFRRTAKRLPRYYEQIKRSTLRLLVPWVSFSIGYTLIRAVFEYLGATNATEVTNEPLGTVLIHTYGSVYAPQMYFLASLFIIRLATPLFGKILDLPRAIRGTLLIALVLLSRYLSGPLHALLDIPGGQEPISHALWGVQFYSFGVLLFSLRRFFLSKATILCIVSFLVAALPLTPYSALKEILADGVFQYSYLIALYCLFLRIGSTPLVVTILGPVGRQTMGIYLLHTPIILKFVAAATNRIIPFAVVVFLCTVLVVVICSLIATKLLLATRFGAIILGSKQQLPVHGNKSKTTPL